MVEGTGLLHAEMDEHFSGVPLAADHRTDLTSVLCSLVFEHAHSILVLIVDSNASSALALVRVQFEALVRAFWIHFAATDAQIAKCVAPIAIDTTKEPDLFPTITEMLAKLDGKSPPTVVAALCAYKAAAWNAMNSYTHGNLRPMIRHRNGYAPELLSQVLQNANGARMFAAMLLAEMTADADVVAGVVDIGRRHAAFLPPLLK
jgi:hypothetical protein